MTYTIGKKKVGPTGYGLMGFSWRPDLKVPDEQAFAALKQALDLGTNFWNGGEFYGRPDPKENLQLLARYFTKYPEDAEKVYLSIKGGVDPYTWEAQGTSESIDRSINTTLEVLGNCKHLDMFCLSRVGTVEIEESVKAIKRFVDAGKVDSICLSEVGPQTIRRAHKIHPIAAVEIEFSLWSREAETNGVFATCKELGIPVIAYSPLGKGFFTGAIKSSKDIPKEDMRSHFDRFQEENFERNKVLVDRLTALALKKAITNSQLALSWIRQLSNTGSNPVIIPIPGTTNPKRVIENNTHVTLTDQDMNDIANMLADFNVAGLRYNKHVEAGLYK
jgi:pyridoxine 4-dehydrogenase